jgi:dephospho-CoA kinase
VAKFLAARGFSVHSLSDIVREAAAQAGLEPSRDNLIATGVSLRAAEVAVLRTLSAFVLIGVDAPRPLRFERSLLRGRLGDGATLEEFGRQEERENTKAETGQQLRATLALADRVLVNDRTIADLHARALALFRELGLDLPDHPPVSA